MVPIDVGFVEDLKKQWMAMIDAVTDPLVILAEDYTILRQNLSYSQMAQSSDLEITAYRGKKCHEVFAGRSSPCSHCKLKDARETGRAQEWQVDDAFQKGHTHVIRVHPLAASDRDKQRFVVHYRDVTEFKSLQDSLAHADKLAALGKLAGGVAHEINSPLAGILAFAQMVLKELPEENPHRADLLEIEEAAKKCKVIVENLLGFARQEKPTEIQNFNLLDCLESTLRLAKAIMGPAQINLDYKRPEQPEDFVIEGQSGKMGQVFLNLITNSIQAIGSDGGTISIVPESRGDVVNISIEDSGTGMEPEVLKKAFDPFFTTKPVGQGTGLGLSISYSIVKQHGGTITAESAVGEGVRIALSLPKHHISQSQGNSCHD